MIECSVSDPDLKARIQIRPFLALIYAKSTNENWYKSLIYV